MDIHKLIAGISPETYCRPELAKQVRRLLRKKGTVSPPEAVLLAAVPAEPKPANLVPLEKLEEIDLFDCPGLKSPRSQFNFTRDAFADSIEAFYFSILNHLEQLEGWQVFKLVDEFQASLLASPFADATKQQSLIQRQVLEGLEAIHGLTQEILETAQQLEPQPSVSAQDEPTTLRQTGTASEVQLRQARLRSQLSSLKLRAAAIRPWLQKGDLSGLQTSHSPSLVNAFNTALFQVLLLAVGPDVLPEAVQTGQLPRWVIRKVRQTYRPVLVLELRFRARPHRSRSQGYAYRGKTELILTSYGLHDDELSVLRQAVETSLTRDSLQMGVGEATAALDSLVHRIGQLVQPQPPSPDDQPSNDTNPFGALFSLLKELFDWLSGTRARQPHAGELKLRPNTSLEAVARSLAILQAAQPSTELYETLKSAG